MQLSSEVTVKSQLSDRSGTHVIRSDEKSGITSVTTFGSPSAA
jgi:hypothetical protein